MQWMLMGGLKVRVRVRIRVSSGWVEQQPFKLWACVKQRQVSFWQLRYAQCVVHIAVTEVAWRVNKPCLLVLLHLLRAMLQEWRH